MSITWIEASAGTGKTFTLVKTVVDLIVNDRLPVERILLVTFTEKATAELKTRIRQGLREAWKKTGDPALSKALEDLASLSITTIHGFCRLLLTQFPLESGVSFEPEMVDQGRQWRRLLRDQIRKALTSLDPHLLLWADLEDEEELVAHTLQALGDNLFASPILHPNADERARFEQIRGELEAGSGALWEALALGRALRLSEDSPETLGAETIAAHLHTTNHRKPYLAVRSLLAARSVYDLAPLLDDETLAYAAKWSIPQGEKGSLWKKGSNGVGSPVLSAVVEVAQAFTLAVEGLQSGLPEGVGLRGFLRGAASFALVDQLCRPVLEQRSSRELTFHDLIERVRHLVTSGGDRGLALGASGRWKAVLIDEFQDTDPEQWDIFRTLFAGPEHQLTLVGDPKQSIYRFRGADLDVYRRVREEVKAAGARCLVLEENFRSTAPMIEAVNTLFAPENAPWDHPDDFAPSRKGDKAIARLLRLEGETETEVAPLAVFRSGEERGWHRHLVRTAAALLDGNHVLDDGKTRRTLDPGDLMILVRKKREAWVLYRMLTKRGIPATVGGSGGLLKGREAQEILLFLKALESPRSLSAGRALAWTRPFQGASLDLLMPALAEAQADYDRGAFLRAFRRVAAALEPGTIDGGGLEHLLGETGGPRLVTNAEHILELVQERYHRGDVKPGQAALALETWIGSGLQEDEVDLRRDGETRTVRLLTVHAAKGLEAPVVLHGYPSSGGDRPQPWILAEGVDFLHTAASVAWEQRQRLAEELRVRYVALTRARCHQVLLDPEAREGLELPSLDGPDPVFGGTKDSARPSPVLAPPLEGLAGRHPWVESHSGLWRRATRDEQASPTVWDRPRRTTEEDPVEVSWGEQLPAGPAFGDLVHDILEDLDYTAASPNADEAARAEFTATVEEHCLRSRSLFLGRDLSRPLQAWLGQALNQPLELDPRTEPLVLGQLSREHTRRELEFHLPLATGAPASFLWGGRSFELHRGYLTGRIDLIFQWRGGLYLADWKTNRLSPGQSPQELMAEAGYDLQAQWYWEALKRLVRVQKEPLEPRGVLYFFLRGDGQKAQSVFLGPETLNAESTLQAFLPEVIHD